MSIEGSLFSTSVYSKSKKPWKVPTFYVKPLDRTMNLRVIQVVIKLFPCESSITGMS